MVLHYCCFNFLGPSNIAMQTQSEFLINYKWRHVQIQQSAQYVFNKKNVWYEYGNLPRKNQRKLFKHSLLHCFAYTLSSQFKVSTNNVP